MTVAYSTIAIAEAEGIHSITLNRPERRNALNPQLIAELTHALGEASRCPCAVVTLTGAGEAFCSGMDLDYLESAARQRPEEQRAEAESIVWLMRPLYEMSKPTIAAVNGPAIAGGAGLAALCDFTLAVPDARFGFTEVRIGFIPAVVSVFLLEMLGDKRTRDLLLSGRIFSASEAKTLGLVTELVEPGELAARTRALAADLRRNSPIAMSGLKAMLSAMAKDRLDTDLARAIRWSEKIRNSADFREGLRAFREKREPVWPARGNK